MKFCSYQTHCAKNLHAIKVSSYEYTKSHCPFLIYIYINISSYFIELSYQLNESNLNFIQIFVSSKLRFFHTSIPTLLFLPPFTLTSISHPNLIHLMPSSFHTNSMSQTLISYKFSSHINRQTRQTLLLLLHSHLFHPNSFHHTSYPISHSIFYPQLNPDFILYFISNSIPNLIPHLMPHLISSSLNIKKSFSHTN